MDGAHINCCPLSLEWQASCNCKGGVIQNTLCCCSFDFWFQYVLSGWEGSAADATLFHDAWTVTSPSLLGNITLLMLNLVYVIPCLFHTKVFTIILQSGEELLFGRKKKVVSLLTSIWNYHNRVQLIMKNCSICGMHQQGMLLSRFLVHWKNVSAFSPTPPNMIWIFRLIFHHQQLQFIILFCTMTPLRLRKLCPWKHQILTQETYQLNRILGLLQVVHQMLQRKLRQRRSRMKLHNKCGRVIKLF